MAANTVVRARIDPELKDKAADILAATGLTVSDAFRMMLVRTVAEKRLPFDPLVPNAETIEAMQAARKGDTRKVGTPRRPARQPPCGRLSEPPASSATTSGRPRAVTGRRSTRTC